MWLVSLRSFVYVPLPAWAEDYTPAAKRVTPGDGETLVVDFTLER